MSDGLSPSWITGFAAVLAVSVLLEVLILTGLFD